MKNTYILMFIVLIVASLAIISSKKKEAEPMPQSSTEVSPATEILTIEKYVKDNIKKMAPNKPVLGGEWYVTTVVVYPKTDTGTVVYEDGHIQSTADFTYVFDPAKDLVQIQSFTIKKQ